MNNARRTTLTAIRHRLACLLLTGVAAMLSRTPAGAQAGPRYSLQAADVLVALRRAGLPAASSVVTLPPNLHAGVGATLIAGPAQRIGPTQLRIQLRCAAPVLCQPFLAEVDLHDAAALAPALQALNAPATNLPPSRHPLHAGEHTTLVLESSHMQITLPVIAIDTGTAGAEIRVATLDRKQTFTGRVNDEGLVRSVMP